MTIGTLIARPLNNSFVPSPSSKKVLFDSTLSPHSVMLAGEIKLWVDHCRLAHKFHDQKSALVQPIKFHPLQFEDFWAGFQPRQHSAMFAAP